MITRKTCQCVSDPEKQAELDHYMNQLIAVLAADFEDLCNGTVDYVCAGIAARLALIQSIIVDPEHGQNDAVTMHAVTAIANVHALRAPKIILDVLKATKMRNKHALN
jgi:hypothetical protein